MISPITAALLVPAVLAWSPTGGYAPGNITCPSSTTAGDSLNFVREANSLSQDEQDWLEIRHNVSDPYLQEFLENANITDFDVDDFFDSLNSSLNIAIAFSGGGYRAMLNGAGQLSALDSRTSGADDHGLGGLLQASTYLIGLSGGNWLTGTIALNNFTSVQEIIEGDTIWDLEDSIFDSGGWNVFSTLGRFDEIDDAIDAKQEAGFNTSITDIWGRALSYQFFGDDNSGMAGLTFSTIRDYEVFQNGSMPFPISVADGRVPGTYIVNLNSTVFEFNPFEMGSWDPNVYAFTDLKYIGTNVSNGAPVNEDECIAGFDNAGFTLGTSSSLFNQIILQLNTTGISGVLYDLIEYFLEDLSEDYDDIAIYEPNPFYKTEYGNSDSILEDEYLYLCDGGEDLQNIPLYPAIQPQRNVDVIFAFDNSADTDDYFPNGTSLVATYERQFESQGNGTSFPYVPDQETFIQNNLTIRPTFFGCNASNMTDLTSIPPLVVYIANTAYSFWSNTSTYKMSYEDDERDSMIQNGFEVASRYNLTMDPDWPKCVACAIIRRQQERNNETQSDDCQECFNTYCWDGSLYEGNETTSYSLNYTSSSSIGDPDTDSFDSDDLSSSSSSGESTATGGSDGDGSGTSKGAALGDYEFYSRTTMFGSILATLAVIFF